MVFILKQNINIKKPIKTFLARAFFAAGVSNLLFLVTFRRSFDSSCRLGAP